MLPRTKARRRALDVLHAADVTGREPLEVLDAEDAPPEATALGRDVRAYARRLVEGVQRHRSEIDDLIRSHADRWALERMPVVDRNVLRIALFEILYDDRVPPGAAINEAVDLAKLLSTEESGRFVNGLLGRVVRDRGAAR